MQQSVVDLKMNLNIICSMVLPSLCMLSIGVVSAQDQWPQFRGLNASGVSTDAGDLPAQLGSENLKWTTPIPNGVSSPCVWRSRIFLTGHEAGNLDK